MGELAMCRVCLAEDVRLRLIANTHLQEMYESLTLLPLETKDSKPTGACYICCAELQNCYQLRKRCLRSEELLTHLLSSDVLQPLNVQEHCTQRFRVEPVMLMSMGDELQDNTDDDAAEERAYRTDAPDVLHLDTVQQQHNEDIIVKLEPHEGHDAQVDDDAQCSHLEDPLDVIKSEPDDVETDTEDATSSKRKIKVEKNEETETLTIKEPKIVTEETRVEKPVTTSKIPETCEKLDIKFNKYKNVVVCEEISTNNTSLELNVSSISISINKPFSCDTCKKGFGSKSHLKNHIRIHTGEKPYRCNTCKKCFNEKGTLNKHFLKHTGEKPYECLVCKKCFQKNDSLKRHIRTHTGEKPYCCTICMKCFNVKSNLKKHSRIHTGEKPHRCEICAKTFYEKADLTRHIRTHTGEKPYDCNFCKKGFNIKSHLESHIRTHTGEKPYVCNFCKKCFRHQSILKNHIRTHTGEKPNECTVCKKCFIKKSDLKNHIRIHTGEKPYICTVCKKCFNVYSSYSRHSLIHKR